MWVIPKTNWEDGDYFNLSPDYDRIRGNILFCYDLSLTLVPAYDIPTLATPTVTGYPTAAFFNNVVSAIRTIAANSGIASVTRDMRTYAAGGAAWNAAELNIIEDNLDRIRVALDALSMSGARRIGFTLGGVRIGS